MSRSLLDANIISDLVRNPSGRVAKRLARTPAVNPCTSILVAAELRYGAARKGSDRLSTVVDGVLARLDVLPFEAPADRVYGALRTDLERRGVTLAANDLLIAAHALALGCVLVSDDQAFARDPGLTVENWLR